MYILVLVRSVGIYAFAVHGSGGLERDASCGFDEPTQGHSITDGAMVDDAERDLTYRAPIASIRVKAAIALARLPYQT